jgi:4-hydroxyphenylacetate 3-monooxygenase
MSMGEQTQTAEKTLPFTGAEYLESIRDDREVWIYGKRVKDVTTHPAFRNSARSIARLYDALHDPAQRTVLTTETDTGNGGFTHPFYRASHSREDLVAARDAIAAW